MKRLFFTTLLLLNFLSPLQLSAEAEYNEYITDVYYGNGVWNTYKQADDAKLKIMDKMLAKGSIKNSEIFYSKDEEPTFGTDTSLGKKYAFKLAYNWHGMYKNDTGHDEQFKQFFDVAETFVQLK